MDKRILIRLYGGVEDGKELRADPGSPDKGSTHDEAMLFYQIFTNKGQIGKKFKRLCTNTYYVYEVTSMEETDDEISIICKVVEADG